MAFDINDTVKLKKLLKYAAITFTVISILFPPFTVTSSAFGQTESGDGGYAFIFSGPKAVNDAKKQLAGLEAFTGSKNKLINVESHINFGMLLVQIAIIWALYFAAIKFGIPALQKAAANTPKE